MEICIGRRLLCYEIRLPRKFDDRCDNLERKQACYRGFHICTDPTCQYLAHEPVEVVVVGSDVVMRQLVEEHLPNRQNLRPQDRNDERSRQSGGGRRWQYTHISHEIPTIREGDKNSPRDLPRL